MAETKRHALVFVVLRLGYEYGTHCTCGYKSYTDTYSRTRRHARKHLSRMVAKGEKVEYIIPEIQSEDRIDTPLTFEAWRELIG